MEKSRPTRKILAANSENLLQLTRRVATAHPDSASACTSVWATPPPPSAVAPRHAAPRGNQLGAHLTRADERRIAVGGGVAGAVLESFVAMELLRQAEWTERPLQLFHYRDKQQREVHVVIERHDGDVIGIEATFARRSVPRTWRHPPARDVAVNPQHVNRNCQATATIARSGITREPETPEGGRCVGAQPRSGGALGLDGSDAQVGQVAEQRSGIPPFAVGGRR